MDKNKYIKTISGLTAIVLTMSLMVGCSKKNSSDKFDTYKNKKEQIVAYSDSYIGYEYLNNYYVIEVFNNITNNKELYIVSKQELNDNTHNYVYKNIFDNHMVTYSNGYCKDYYLELISEVSLLHYIDKYSMIKDEYSYKDIERLYNMIKEEYTLDNNKIKKRSLI